MASDAKSNGVEIYLQPAEVWDFVQKNKAKMETEMFLIAEDKEMGREIFVTEEEGLIMVYVTRDDENEYDEAIVSRKDCETTISKLYVMYFVEGLDDDEIGMTRQDLDDEIYQREDELMLAFLDFLSIVFEMDAETYMGCGYEDDIADMLEHCLRYLSDEHGVQIYRPMFVVDEATGEEVFVPYPYDSDMFGVEEENG